MEKTILDYVMTQGPWAAVSCFLVWLWLRTRKESAAAIAALVKEKTELTAALLAEKNARRTEGFELNNRQNETISKLVILMERVEGALNRFETVAVRCMKHSGSE